MSDETTPTSPETPEAPHPRAAAAATVPDEPERPLEDANLAELEEELVTVRLREHYTIPRDGHKQPHKGPKTLNMPLSDAHQHKAKLQERGVIAAKWKAIQQEKEHRRAERNLAGDVNQPAKRT